MTDKNKDKVFTAEEVKKHNTRKSVWTVIRNDVYDLTAFIDEHPGGEDPILEAAGQDSTIAFEDVGHSEDAKIMMKKYKIGSLAPGEGWRGKPRRPPSKPSSPPPPESQGSRWKWALAALGAAIVIGFVVKKYLLT